ncbi:MAG: nickel ABC transporter substrate-binding protein, partial [Spirochaetales bacterium]|nr:nickel ABC transporter substrate-binding protein [Spirochaetales bacterium]
MKIFTALTLAALIFTGCSSESGSETSEPRTNDRLTFVNYRDIRDLNPHLYAGEMYAQEILFERLVVLTADGYAPSLAESWEISEDGLVYTFKIREGVTFHDGEKLDAFAVEKNFDALIENRARHTWLEMMRLLVSAEALDENTFQITMEAPYYPMLTELAVTRPFAIMAPAAMKEGSPQDGVEANIGTGPYKLDSYVTDEYAIFTAYEDYWGGAPAIKEIYVKVIPDNQTRILALENGEIDLIYGKNMLDADAINKYSSSDRFEVALSEPTSTRHILLNTQNEILQDINVRMAIQHATNKEAISQGIFYGLEKPADALYSPTVPYCNVPLTAYDFNMDKAEEYLEAGGWILEGDTRVKEGRALELTLRYNSDSVTEKSIAEYLQSEYRKIGISLSILGEEEQSYRDNMKSGAFDLVFNISWGMPYDPQSSLAAMLERVYGDYEAQLGIEAKPEIDKAIHHILTSVDEAERQELYNFVLRELHYSACYLPLTYESNKALYVKELKNVGFTQSQYEVP